MFRWSINIYKLNTCLLRTQKLVPRKSCFTVQYINVSTIGVHWLKYEEQQSNFWHFTGFFFHPNAKRVISHKYIKIYIHSITWYVHRYNSTSNIIAFFARFSSEIHKYDTFYMKSISFFYNKKKYVLIN
jgi:hypothetical protein